MTTFINKLYDGKRDPECTNIIACIAEKAPEGSWEECDEIILCKLTLLYIQNGVQYYGYL